MVLNEKQTNIIATAERLFSLKGYDGTSVRDIADEAGVNIAMISYYFGSKEKLMEALFHQRSNNLKLRIASLLQDELKTPLEKMNLLVDEYIDRAMEKQQFFKIMVCEQVINKNPVIINLIYELKKTNTEEVSKLVRSGQEKGDFKKNVDVMLLMSTLFGPVTHMMLTLEYYKEYNQLEQIPDDQFYEQVKKKLSNHIKFLFKAQLIYEA